MSPRRELEKAIYSIMKDWEFNEIYHWNTKRSQKNLAIKMNQLLWEYISGKLDVPIKQEDFFKLADNFYYENKKVITAKRKGNNGA